MPFEDEGRYDGVVTSAGLSESTERGTPFLWFRIKTDEGPTSHDMYLTANTRERAAETLFKCFGITPQQLSAEDFLEKFDSVVSGKKVSVVMESEEGRKKGDVFWKVKWMNPISNKPPASPRTKSSVAALFGGRRAAPAQQQEYRGDGPPPMGPVSDDDVPF